MGEAGAIQPAQTLELARTLGAACAAADGVPPFNDQALVELARGERRAIGDGTALAVASDAEREVELAVHPEHRGLGLGTALAHRVAAELGTFEAWAHGDLPAARAIAVRLPATRVRTLLQLRAPVSAAAADQATAGDRLPDGTADPASAGDRLPDGTRPFEPADASALLALNAAAFADHPEQGRMSADDLAARMAEPWHDDANLVVAPSPDGDGGLDAFTWVKPQSDGIAELYVLGVSTPLIEPGRTVATVGKVAAVNHYISADEIRSWATVAV